MASRGDVRIGSMWFHLARGDLYDQTGIRPLRRTFRSLFAERSNVSGAPGLQNVRTEDLRWMLDDFSGGEGRRVQRADDERPMFDHSVGIDLMNPGELRLARSMQQVGLTGDAPTTTQADAWNDDVGTSTVVSGTDRRLNNVGDRIRKLFTPAAGTYQVEFYGYEAGPPVVEGNTLNEVKGKSHNNAGPADKVLESEGTLVETGNLDPINGDVAVTAYLSLLATGGPAANAKVEIAVYNKTDEKIVTADSISLSTFGHGGAVSDTAKVTFEAKASKNYRYRVKLLNLSNAAGVTLDRLEYDEKDTRTLKWQIKNNAGGIVAQNTTDLNGTTSSQRVAVATVVTDGLQWELTAAYNQGASRRIFLDKAVYTLVGLNQPQVAELGLNNSIWIVDYKFGVPPQFFYWDADTDTWEGTGTFAAAGVKPIAMAHSDSYEFAACDNDIIYRGKKPATSERYSATAVDKLVGIAVGANRLYALTESVTSGTQLFDAPLEGTPNVALTARAMDLPLGINPDTSISQRMAGKANGVVFFVNQGADCFVYQWNAGSSAGSPLAKLPPGFNGRAVVHGNGLTWVGGGFPAVDDTGAERVRPAVFIVDNSGNVQQLDVKLWRDEDNGTQIRSMQLYGQELYIGAEVKSDPNKMRLWRVHLASPTAAFCEQEITVDDSQANGEARSIAVNWRDKILVWSKGSPYHERDDRYRTAQDARLVSSRYNYGLSEEKLLLTARVTGTFPEGTKAEIRYSIDDGEFSSAYEFNRSERVVISGPDQPVEFKFVQVEVSLSTNDPVKTPVVYSVELKAYNVRYDKAWELMIECMDETSVYRIDGQQLPGSAALDYLFDLADAGSVVEFEDAFTHQERELAGVYNVLLEDPDLQMFDTGNGLVHLKLTERNL